mmetsp:Transcript_93303/g.237440  ORF Transcript_93303/g.237440 Transcript_93303/m.237440 type:complete len:215 (+) Transcript_93303:194-838(+)
MPNEALSCGRKPLPGRVPIVRRRVVPWSWGLCKLRRNRRDVLRLRKARDGRRLVVAELLLRGVRDVTVSLPDHASDRVHIVGAGREIVVRYLVDRRPQRDAEAPLQNGPLRDPARVAVAAVAAVAAAAVARAWAARGAASRDRSRRAATTPPSWRAAPLRGARPKRRRRLAAGRQRRDSLGEGGAEAEGAGRAGRADQLRLPAVHRALLHVFQV